MIRVMAEGKGKKDRNTTGLMVYVVYLVSVFLGILIIAQIVRIQLFFRLDSGLKEYFLPRNSKVLLEPTRGAIIARDGRLLALSTPMYQVYMDCAVQKGSLNEKQEAEWMAKARELSGGLAAIYNDRSAGEYYELIRTGRRDNRRYVKIGSAINHETLQKVKNLPLFSEGANKGGFLYEKKDSRQYPYGTLARRTIGYVRDNSDGNNLLGLEGKFNFQLHGREGYEWMKTTDNRRRIHNYDSSYVKAEDGYDIRTTLDIDIQDISDRALRKQIEDNPKIEGGCVIVMDVKTGGIRAMVNLLRDSDGVLGESYNLAIGRTGEPGSVFKTSTLMSLLEDGRIRLGDEIPTNHGDLKGFSRDQHIADYEREEKTDRISVQHGFDISSNYVFRKLAIDNYGSNPKKMIDKLYMYKLGEAYDFDLEGFKAPSIPDPGSKNWSGTDLGSVAIGYSVSETPLHMVTFYNAVANKGKMMKPYLVESIEKNGSVKEKRGRQVLNSSICSKATADTLTKALMSVVSTGTGRRRLGGARCTIAGKTGTARIVLDPKYTQKSRNPYQDEFGRRQYQATFVGFFPAEDPQYTAIVVVYSNLDRETFYGGTLPALAFREMVDNIYALDERNGEVLGNIGKVPSWNRKKEKEEQDK